MALFFCSGTEPHMELFKRKAQLGVQWNLRVGICQFKAEVLPVGPGWWHHPQPQAEWGLPAVLRSGWLSLTKVVILRPTFRYWMMATAVSSLHLLCNRSLYEIYSISLIPDLLLFVFPSFAFFKPLFLVFSFWFSFFTSPWPSLLLRLRIIFPIWYTFFTPTPLLWTSLNIYRTE